VLEFLGVLIVLGFWIFWCWGIVLGTWDPRSWRLGEFPTWNLEGVRVFGFWGRFIFQLKAK